jgi:hypothetical protein
VTRFELNTDFFRSISLPFHNGGIVDMSMKAKHRPWTPEQHRRYMETLGPHFPAILKSLGFLVLAIGAAISLIANNAAAASWATKLLTWLK